MKGIQKTIYFTEDLIKGIGEFTNFSSRVIELVKKGIEYEKGIGQKVNGYSALGYFNAQYKKKHPTENLPIIEL